MTPTDFIADLRRQMDFYYSSGRVDKATNLAAWIAENLAEAEKSFNRCPHCNNTLEKVTTSIVTPFGTSHWAGTYAGCPAITLSYHGGASLFYFQDGDWQKTTFESLNELHSYLGLP